MHLLLKLSSLLTIVFYIFIWAGCGSEEPPESQKTVTKKISVKPPTTPKKTVAQDSTTLPAPSPKLPNQIISKTEQSKTIPDAAKKPDRKKAPKPPSEDKPKGMPPPPDKAVTPAVVDEPKPSKASEDSSKSEKPLLAKKEESKPALPIKTVPNTKETTKESISPTVSAKPPDFTKASTQPKDVSVVKIAPETDSTQPPQEDDGTPSDSETDASPSLITENPESETEERAPDVQSPVEVALASGKTTSSYDPKGRIDPFVPFITVAKPTVVPDHGPVVESGPLEKADIDQLQLVGIIRAPSGNLALVQLADGKGYIIQTGTPIGIKKGHVAEILADKVVVEEKSVDSHNEPITVERLMKIKKPIGEL